MGRRILNNPDGVGFIPPPPTAENVGLNEAPDVNDAPTAQNTPTASAAPVLEPTPSALSAASAPAPSAPVTKSAI